ncbi:MAG: hypothetical protein Q9196_004640 [Gyalolechia fulgens]
MSLRTGTELITLSILFNKVSGIYGLLALLTGFHLSPLQLSMYIYSLIALVITVLLASHIRSQSPFHCLALACFYILDSVINAAYTAAFAITWFLVLSQHHSDASGDKAPGAGGSTIDDTAGFTSPQYNVSHVDVAVAPDQGVSPGHQAVAVGQPGFSTTASGPSLGHGVLQPESMSSIFTICALWAVRAYFVLVVMSYARHVLRQHVAAMSRSNTALHTGSKSSTLAENPFEPHLPDGKGWKGKLGRLMIRLGKSYWLGSEEGDAEWMNNAQSFRRREDGTSSVPGVVERERRRRSGTGPPPPIPPLQAGQYLRVQDAR